MPSSTAPSGEPRALLRDQVFQHLFNAIATGALAPGSHLNDAELASELGASKAPVREALQQLREIGFVEIVPNRFTRVTELNPSHLSKSINTMWVYYELAIRVGVPALAGDFEAIEEVMAEMREATRSDDRPAFSATMYYYFRALAEAANHGVLLRSMERLTPHLQRTLAPRPGLIQPEQIMVYLERVHERALAGDVDGAAAAFNELAATPRANYIRSRTASTES